MTNNNQINPNDEILLDEEENMEEDKPVNKWQLEKIREAKFIKLSNILFGVAAVLFVVYLLAYGSVLFIKSKVEPGFTIREGWKSQVVEVAKKFLQIVGYISEQESDIACSKLNTNFEKTEKEKLLQNFRKCIESKQTNVIVKKNMISQFVNKLYKEYKTNISAIEKIKENIANYAFLPKEIDDLIFGGNVADLLVTIEGIRLSAYINLYERVPYLRQLLVEASGKALKDELIKKVVSKYIKKGGDNLIRNYLILCYFNPFVESADSSQCVTQAGIDDFGNYMKTIYKIPNADNLVLITERILGITLDKVINSPEGTNLHIVFNSMDPKSKKISFKAEVITYKDLQKSRLEVTEKDKMGYFGNGQIDPHIYLATTFINLLRGSHFILGDNIRINTLKVNKKKLKTAKNLVAEVSNFNFDVKLQPSVVREIYDFVYR